MRLLRSALTSLGFARGLFAQQFGPIRLASLELLR